MNMTASGLYPRTHEIAHSVVLPPADGVPDVARVLFWNRIHTETPVPCTPPGSCDTAGQPGLYGRAFVFKPLWPSRTSVVQIEHPTYDSTEGTESLFCGAQTLFADGSVGIIGGTNRVEQCLANNCSFGLDAAGFGHKTIVRMFTEDDPPTVEDPSLTPILHYPRWYPNAIILEDASMLVAGHEGDPTVPPADKSRERLPFDETTRELWPTTLDQNLLTGVATCGTTVDMSAGDYPRLHMLTTGDVIDAGGVERVGNDIVPLTRYLNRRLEPFVCAPDDWIRSNGNDQQAVRHGGNSVHIIARDPTDPTQIVEVIYAIGGSDEHNESDRASTELLTASVEMIQSPGIDSPWQTMNPLNRVRKNHNSVLLANGSILVVGGETASTPPLCEDVVIPELYEPAVVFEGTSPVWTDMAENPVAIGRGYHSTAGLLPDGRVYVAGGVENTVPGPTTPHHTVEIYSPPYAFVSRPVIDRASILDTTPFYGESLVFNVALTSAALEHEVDRVALIRSSASTHAWDSNQRYVELQFDPPTGPFENRLITAHIPPPSTDLPAGMGDYMLPPGFYLLVVIDKNHVPSVGEWIQILHDPS